MIEWLQVCVPERLTKTNSMFGFSVPETPLQTFLVYKSIFGVFFRTFRILNNGIREVHFYKHSSTHTKSVDTIAQLRIQVEDFKLEPFRKVALKKTFDFMIESDTRINDQLNQYECNGRELSA